MKKPLTFGVELEMAVAGLKTSTAYSSSGDPRTYPSALRSTDLKIALQYISKVLNNYDIPAETETKITDGYSIWLTNNFNSWVVKTDESIKPTAGVSSSCYHYHQVEIVSPVLSYTPEALEQVKRVCDIL
jgi:hypothetical protein